MNDELVEIRVLDGFLEAEILKAKLESYDVPCMLKQETVGRLFGLTLSKLGRVKLIVPLEYKDKAEEILNEKA